MAIEFAEEASSGGGACSGNSSSGYGGGYGGANDLLQQIEDDWATDEPDLLAFKSEADENMTAMWNMDSIDVASTFAGEPSAVLLRGEHIGSSSEHGVATAADALFDVTLTNWWDQPAASGVELVGAFESSLKTASTLHPSMSPLAVKQSASVPDKEVTDALLAVFAPHAILANDDSQTDSGTESNSSRLPFGELTLSRADSSASNVSSSSNVFLSSSTADSGDSVFTQSASKPPKPTSASKKGKGKAKARTASTETVSVKLEQLADDEKDLTPLEIRRKRNRESMQRARQRQRDDVDEMKETLQELEAHYQKLSDAAQERRGHSESQIVAAITSSSRNQGSQSQQQQRLEADYYAVADLSHTLKEEKFMLEQLLTDKQKTYRRMEQVMVDRVQELELPCPTTTTPESLFSDFEFTPITEEQSNELIRQCYVQILQFQDAATPLTPPRGMKASTKPSSAAKPQPAGTMVTSNPFPPTATFGWKVSCHVTPDKDFFVSFAKYFKGVSAEEAMLSSWSRFNDPQKGRAPHRKLLRYEVLQRVNDSTYVAGVDIHHPVKKDKQMRNIFCRFRLQTAQGYVIGRSSMNPKSPEVRKQAEQQSSFEYVDNYSWIEFTTVVDPITGEDGVCVKFNARTEYNTQEDTHLRLVNSLYLTLQWECAVIPNTKLGFFLSLTPPS